MTMTAQAIRDHFVSLLPVVDPTQTNDQIIVGDPDRKIDRVLVAWMGSFKAIREAADRHFDMLIVHEPAFWAGPKLRIAQDAVSTQRRKRQFLEDHGLVLLRIHDTWDSMPQIGIPWAWARFLELGQSPAACDAPGHQHRYDIEPLPAGDLARGRSDRRAG